MTIYEDYYADGSGADDDGDYANGVANILGQNKMAKLVQFPPLSRRFSSRPLWKGLIL